MEIRTSGAAFFDFQRSATFSSITDDNFSARALVAPGRGRPRMRSSKEIAPPHLKELESPLAWVLKRVAVVETAMVHRS